MGTTRRHPPSKKREFGGLIFYAINKFPSELTGLEGFLCLLNIS